jgi:hypothetical protein
MSDIDTIELVGGPLDGELRAVPADTPRLVFPTLRGAGRDGEGVLVAGQLVYADTGRRTADGRRAFAPAG